MTTVEVTLLGPVSLHTNGRRKLLGAPKLQCLFTALALNPGRPVPLNTVVGRLWGHTPPEKHINSLYCYVARLRRLLNHETMGAVILRTEAAGYSLVLDPACVDVHRSRGLFRQAEAAVASGRDDEAAQYYQQALRLWLGEPLAGLRGQWAASVRAGLILEHLAILTGYLGTELRLGRHREILVDLSAARTEHPLDESIAGLLMIGLHRSGRYTEALNEFHLIKLELATQLGLDPGPDLTRLYQRLLRNDADLVQTSP